MSEGATGEVSLFTSQSTSFCGGVQPLFHLVTVEHVFRVFLEEVHVRRTLAFVSSVCTILK